ncbi:MAG: hypothetical protein Kow0079_05390 [Vicingaceae bacterium]|jgi:copper chaperone CopZ
MKSNENNSSKALLTGLLAAIAASSCCIPPVIAAIAGISGAAGSLSWVEPFRPYLIGFAIIAIGYAWYNYLKPKKADDCGCSIEKPKWYQTKTFLILITIFAAISISFPYYSHLFFKNKNSVITTTNNDHQVSYEFEIEGMTCEACQYHVEDAVASIKGIINASASYEKGNAIVKFNNKETSVEAIESAINSTGYTVINKKKLNNE